MNNDVFFYFIMLVKKLILKNKNSRHIVSMIFKYDLVEENNGSNAAQ